MTSGTKTGKRTTKQRELVADIVRSLKSHPTAEEVYQIAKRTIGNISLGTVYRNLRLLEDEGIINEVQFEDGLLRFDGMLEEHEHFVCKNCGAILDIAPTPLLQPVPSSHPDLVRATVTGYRLSYYGLCASCTDGTK